MSDKQSSSVQKEHIEEIKKNCGKCLKDILRSASETKEISRCAEYELEAQTEQMKRIRKEVNAIENILLQSQSNLQKIKSLWFSVYSYFGFADIQQKINYIGEDNENDEEDDESDEEDSAQLLDIKIDCQPKPLTDNPQDGQHTETSTALDVASTETENFDKIYEDGLNSLNIMVHIIHVFMYVTTTLLFVICIC